MNSTTDVTLSAMPVAAIPAWVPAVLLLLLFLGYRQSTTRDVRPAALVSVAAVMFFFSLYGVIKAFGGDAVAIALWATGYAAVMAFGGKLFSSARMAAVGARVRVPGSWIPLGLFMGTFFAKFVLGFATGVHSPLVQSVWFMDAMSLAFGALSGGFGARALAVQRVAKAA